MDISAIRKANLIRLLESYSTQREFAEIVDTPASYITQITQGTLGKNGKPVSLGNTVARRIEKKLNLSHGYMDVDHTNAQNVVPFNPQVTPKSNDLRISPVEFKSSFENKHTIRIPVHKNVRASCGDGVANFLEDVTDYLEVDPNFLKLMGINIKPERLRIIYSSEYSMWPTVTPDSPLFVDTTPVDTSTMISGDVYVFLHNSLLRMKRVFVSYGDEKTVRLQSDNPDKKKYPDEVITREQLNELVFLGRLELSLVKP
ncbi:peptidase S24 [Acinetobacter pittii]|uniref:S24 family peptidase n=1 Tax=Acinetobacter calcoaceticus/baumannii complex TaxID=909768 RepID=UPI00070F71C5|nr:MULTISPECIES: S24 family peptidase [Acinetobacter calcoaceticus/baumannii complex]ELA7052283.1 S24 family peptidase [Acinetobacter baumannii]KRI49462.1 peptidase S24 [Acinetobacter pittii]